MSNSLTDQSPEDRATKIFARLREEYLGELPDRITDVENLILNINSADHFVDVFQDLFRKVHSMKGSGGTYGYQILTTICHHLEDQLNQVDERHNSLTAATVDNCMVYVDLLRQANEQAQRGGDDYDAISQKLLKLVKTQKEAIHHYLFVEKSLVMRKLCQQALKEFKVDYAVCTSGYEALGRLFDEKFDGLITGMETGHLNGLALITALRHSDSSNRNIPSFLLTSSITDDRLPIPAGPTFVIHRGADMADLLVEAYQSALRT